MKRIDIDQAIGNIKATMQYENQELTEKEVNLCSEILKGSITGEAARRMILEELVEI